MKFYSWAAVFFLALSAVAALNSAQPEQTVLTVSKQPVQETKLPETLSSSQKDLLLKIDRILKKAEESNPSFKRLMPENEDASTEALIKVLNSGFIYTDAEGVKKIKALSYESAALYKAIKIYSGKIIYCRVDSFNEKSFKLLQEDLLAMKEDKNIEGIIIDIRSCSGTGWQAAVKALALFCDLSKTSVNQEALPPRLIHVPFLLLTGSKTSGAAEILIHIAKSSKQGLSLGERSSGHPFAMNIISLENGKFLAVPEIPEFIPPGTHLIKEPAIPMKNSEQIDHAKLAAKPVALEEDPVLVRATETLRGINILNSK